MDIALANKGKSYYWRQMMLQLKDVVCGQRGMSGFANNNPLGD
jgi:hypothetical protein